MRQFFSTVQAMHSPLNTFKKAIVFLVAALALVEFAHADFEYEPNNSIATANSLSFDTPVNGQLSSGTDKDYYAVSLTAPTVLSIQFTPPSGTYWDFVIKFYKADGTLISSTQTTKSTSLYGLAASAGNYYIAVMPYYSSSYESGTYQIQASKTTLSLSSFETESNDTIATANSLSLGAPVSGQLSSGTDKDYFVINASSQGVMNILFTPPTGAYWDYKVNAYSADGTLLAGWTTTTEKTYQIGVPAAGNYYVAVTPYYSSSYEKDFYKITLSFTGSSSSATTTSTTTSTTKLATTTTTTSTTKLATTTTSTSTTTTMASIASNPSLFVGWNLVGNGTASTASVSSVLGDTNKVISVWKWLSTKSQWAFYTPSLSAQELATYAAGKGYEVLSTIGAGEGIWVNAKTAFSAALASGTPVSSSAFQTLGSGWSLIATGDNLTPIAFNSALSANPPSTGTYPSNVTTLWAWDASKISWYFFAPSLQQSGGLVSYNASKGYLDFGAKTLTSATGFWVNMPTTTDTTVISSMDLRTAWASKVRNGFSKTFSVSGTCSGTATLSDSGAKTLTTFEAATAYSAVSTATINLTNCTPATSTSSTTDYYDANGIPLGWQSDSGYAIYSLSNSLPATVKLGDTGKIGTKTKYTDSSKSTLVETSEDWYAIEPDTNSTVIFNIISKTYNPAGVLTSTEQNRYRMSASSGLSLISMDLQFSNGSTTHLIFR